MPESGRCQSCQRMTWDLIRLGVTGRLRRAPAQCLKCYSDEVRRSVRDSLFTVAVKKKTPPGNGRVKRKRTRKAP